MIRALALCLAAAMAPAAAHAVDCSEITFEGLPFTICEVDPAAERLGLHLRDGDGDPIGHFGALEEATGAEIPFAMNAGMYHPDRRPVGLYIEDGEEIARLVPGAGPGNFGMVPNGVLCIAQDSARVWETRAFLAARPACRDATQSGPMLVVDGALHPRFIDGSDSRYVRNGVGTDADGSRAVFAISDVAVNFHTFGRLFRDRLGLPQALYLDGNVSRLHAPALGRSDLGAPMGPIVAVTR